MMVVFKDAISALGQALETSNASHPRDLSDVIAKDKAMNEIADQAHKLF